MIQNDNVYVEIVFKNSIVLFYHNTKYSSIECFVTKRGNHVKYHLSAVLEFNDKEYSNILNNHSSRPIKDLITGRTRSEEQVLTAGSAVVLFAAIVKFKDWKRTKMKELGLDFNNADDMRDSRVSFDQFPMSEAKITLSIAFSHDIKKEEEFHEQEKN